MEFMAEMNELESLNTTWALYRQSTTELDDTKLFLARSAFEKRLGVAGDCSGFKGDVIIVGNARLFTLSPDNAIELRRRLPWLIPVPLGLHTSIGLGDRLGLATPGHIRAAHKFPTIAPVFAQQSVRENKRTGRTPQEVVDQAMWGIFETGWRAPWGADADHLKLISDVDEFVRAGYTFFTIDPGEYVDDSAQTASATELMVKLEGLPWSDLETTTVDMGERYLNKKIDLGGLRLTIEPGTLWRAAAKYGRAIAHTLMLYRSISERMDGTAFDLEISVDETNTPTSPEEHFYIASELHRLGVYITSLAPRYTGRFEKGVDYIGDLQAFATEFSWHAAIAQALGPYKLGLHSGSDKFSIYPIITHLTNGLAHVKTAGTSYLEALRVVARVDPSLFREILSLAIERYDEDRHTYHVSGRLTNLPSPQIISNAELPDLLNQFDARQVLHVTFGSVIDRFGEHLRAILTANENLYYNALEIHFTNHLAPLPRGNKLSAAAISPRLSSVLPRKNRVRWSSLAVSRRTDEIVQYSEVYVG